MKIQLFKKLTDVPEIEKFNNNLPIFASQEYANYLQNVKNYSTIWFYGIVDSDIQFILPFAIRKKNGFKNAMFLTSTVYLSDKVDLANEQIFLNNIIEIIKQKKLCDWIAQPPNWAIFNAVPSNSIYCEFGTYRIDLQSKSEEELFSEINYHHKRLINKSLKNNVLIKNSSELLDDCVTVFNDAILHGNYTLPSKNEIIRLLKYLPDNTSIYVSYNEINPKSSIICFLNKFCSFAVYIGNSPGLNGENHLLHWEAIKDAKLRGIRYFDFVGARMNPLPGSKLEGIQKFKKYFGGELIKGYLWKMPISNLKYRLYNIIIFVLYSLKFKKYKGDIIDQELKKAGN